MKTPVYDFLNKYAKSDVSRFHMPGHKGHGILGIEKYDITEIDGADNLFLAEGIIAESEANASKLFESGKTFYSTEGSSLSIKAMIYAAMLCSDKKVRKIAAVRNVHKSFINACAMLDIDVEWIYPADSSVLCSGIVTPEEAENFLLSHSDVFALYLTSPDYLGEMTDISGISTICKKHNIPLLVDNAHGAYLKFCNMHPLSMGADMCCDSAHKTLPVLTGGAYLHISKEKAALYAPYIKQAMSAFGSTSPSYLIMASLDLCNSYIENGYKEKLKRCTEKITALKTALTNYDFYNSEPLKISIKCNGAILGAELQKKAIEYEFADSTALVLMVSPENTDEDFIKLETALKSIYPQPPQTQPKIYPGKKVLTVRQAFMMPYETVDIDSAKGRICATPSISCPPAVPIAVSGELITEDVINVFKFYKKETVDVIIQK